jgi:hypothetical protein
MITEKIKNLFDLVEFINSNVDKLTPVIEMQMFDEERKKLKTNVNFTYKLLSREYKEVVKENSNLVNPFISEIKTKAEQLNICNPLESETLWNWNISEIQNLKNNFDKDDLMEILLYKLYYIEIKTYIDSCKYFDLFFVDLYEILNQIFDYFDTGTKTETKAPGQGKPNTLKQQITFEELITPAAPLVNKITDFGKFKFEQSTLSVLHGNFDGKLWDNIDINEFYNNFKEIPLKTLIIKSKPAFCYLIAKYENKKSDISNINHWMKEHFNISNYSRDKNKPSYDIRQGKNAKFYEIIDNIVKIDQQIN